MAMQLEKDGLRRWIPPVILGLLSRARRDRTRFVGSYASWQSAADAAVGYGEGSILDKVQSATRKVVDGQAAFERDSVIFDAPDYPYPLIAVLLRAATERQGNLTVLDFGGALGSSYYQCRPFLAGLARLRWCVVEQDHYVRCGRAEFEREQLRFFNRIDACLCVEAPNVALLSGVLQYLERPIDTIAEIAKTDAEYVVIDRTPYSILDEQRLTVQVVQPSIYAASYPTWLFRKATVLDAMQVGGYRLLAEFDAVDGVIGHGRNRARFKGMAFRKSDQYGPVPG